MRSHVIIDTLCFNINREERQCHERELYRLRRERETTEERQERLCTWPLLQFYSVRTRHEMDDILDVKNACKSVQSLIHLWMYVINFYHNDRARRAANSTEGTRENQWAKMLLVRARIRAAAGSQIGRHTRTCLLDSMCTVGTLSTYNKMSPLLLTHCQGYPMNWISLLSEKKELLTLIITFMLGDR